MYQRVLPFLRWAYGQLPGSFRETLDEPGHELMKFLEFAATRIADKAVLIDAGCGAAPFKRFFPHVKYIRMDRWSSRWEGLDIVADISSMPIVNSCCDAVLCTFVLEHVTEPRAILSEFHRVLKPGGVVIMTVPFGDGLHMRPFDYYRYTPYGLHYLTQSAGFQTVFVKPLGGYFGYIAHLLKVMVSNTRSGFIKLLLAPLFYVIVPFLSYCLDILDRRGTYSLGLHATILGYGLYCEKPYGDASALSLVEAETPIGAGYVARHVLV